MLDKPLSRRRGINLVGEVEAVALLRLSRLLVMKSRLVLEGSAEDVVAALLSRLLLRKSRSGKLAGDVDEVAVAAIIQLDVLGHLLDNHQ